MTAIPGKGYDSLDTLVTLTQEAPGAMNFGALGATTAEAGYPDTRYVFWAGMFAPAGTPQEIIDSLNSAVLEALADDANAERLANIHVQPMPMTADEFSAFIADEIEANADLVERANIVLQ